MTPSPYIQTASGLAFHFLSPRPEDITIDDIAYQLAREPRWGSATVMPFYVADHSIQVALLVIAELEKENLPYKMVCEAGVEALLHDASEAYLKDLPGPIKHALPGYMTLEERVQNAIYGRFGIARFFTDEIKRADLIVRATEARDLTLRPELVTDCLNVTPMRHHLVPMTSHMAERKFLEMFHSLRIVYSDG